MTGVNWRLEGAPPWWRDAARRFARARGDIALLILDAVLVVVAYLGMLVARYDTAVPSEAWSGMRLFLPFAIAAHLLANWAAGLYRPVWAQASVREAQRLLVAGPAAVAVLIVFSLALPRIIPLSVVIVGGVIATGLLGVLRFQERLFAFRRRSLPEGSRLLVVGAGKSAGAILRELSRDERQPAHVQALLDDDPNKLGRRLDGVPIVGAIEDLTEVGRTLEIDQVLLAIPTASSELVRMVADATADLGVPLKVLPALSEWANGKPKLRDVRDLSIDDLLGRQQVATDLASVQALVRGRRVLVTGAGGSIGSEIARQIASYEPARLLALDHDETHLFDLAHDLDGSCVQILMDVRDGERLRQLFAEHRPDIVFHAAAHKHVPLLEAHPCEAVATNVVGTANVVAAAREAGVGHVVFISTDKAVNPTSVMGASKRVGEQLALTSAPAGAAWCAVRFGNVLGSRGSVVPTFLRQIRQGGPVTVTHPEMTRYFMSIPEAVQLVLQAAALAEDREVFMLDMGEPVRILDLANRMIALAGYRPGVDVRIAVTGLRPGEKLAEELNGDDEHPFPTSHPKIVQLSPPLLDDDYLSIALDALIDSVATQDDAGAKQLLFEAAHYDPTIIRLPARPLGPLVEHRREHA